MNKIDVNMAWDFINSCGKCGSKNIFKYSDNEYYYVECSTVPSTISKKKNIGTPSSSKKKQKNLLFDRKLSQITKEFLQEHKCPFWKTTIFDNCPFCEEDEEDFDDEEKKENPTMIENTLVYFCGKDISTNEVKERQKLLNENGILNDPTNMLMLKEICDNIETLSICDWKIAIPINVD